MFPQCLSVASEASLRTRKRCMQLITSHDKTDCDGKTNGFMACFEFLVGNSEVSLELQCFTAELITYIVCECDAPECLCISMSPGSAGSRPQSLERPVRTQQPQALCPHLKQRTAYVTCVGTSSSSAIAHPLIPFRSHCSNCGPSWAPLPR